jgi:hypothetical protein
MIRKIYAFRFVVLILIAAILPLSCATKLPQPATLSSPNDKSSIVFGKLEVMTNGEPMKFKTSRTFLDNPAPFMVCHISRYVSDAKLNRNTLIAGQYEFRAAVDKDGYFSFIIPPGKYYFVEPEYFYVFSNKPAFGTRTYMYQNPFLLTFDVPADRAVYIGTIWSDFDVKWNNLFLFKAFVSIGVTNNFADAKNWFLKSNPQLETNVVDGTTQFRFLPQTQE